MIGVEDETAIQVLRSGLVRLHAEKLPEEVRGVGQGVVRREADPDLTGCDAMPQPRPGRGR